MAGGILRLPPEEDPAGLPQLLRRAGLPPVDPGPGEALDRCPAGEREQRGEPLQLPDHFRRRAGVDADVRDARRVVGRRDIPQGMVIAQSSPARPPKSILRASQAMGTGTMRPSLRIAPAWGRLSIIVFIVPRLVLPRSA